MPKNWIVYEDLKIRRGNLMDPKCKGDGDDSEEYVSRVLDKANIVIRYKQKS